MTPQDIAITALVVFSSFGAGFLLAHFNFHMLLSTLQQGQRIKVAGKVLRVEEGGAE